MAEAKPLRGKMSQSSPSKVHEKAKLGFETAGDSYVRGRPEYPLEAVHFLLETLQIKPTSKIVDLAAGTGKFTKFLLESRADLVAVEPVAGMIKKFSELYPEVSVLYGTAENMPFESESVDAVFVAQAFHWFDGEKALEEIYRILKPSGSLALIWNARDESVPWLAELSLIMLRHQGSTPQYKTKNWQKDFQETKLFSPLQNRQFSYLQKGDVETVVDRVASVSFISALSVEERDKVLAEVRDLVNHHTDLQNSSEIVMPYRTDVFWCRKVLAT